MYSKIKVLRRGGTRRSDKEIASDPGIVGHITVCLIENIVFWSIHSPMASGRPSPMVPGLWKGVVITMNGDRMLVRGWERIGNQEDPDAQVQAQEWSIQIMVEQPAALARASHRPPV